MIGGAIGVWLATAGVRGLLAANPDSIPRAGEIIVDFAVLGFTLGSGRRDGSVFRRCPLLHLSQQSMNISLREGGSRTTAGTAKARMRGALVDCRGCAGGRAGGRRGLLLRSFWNLMRSMPGSIARPSDDVPARTAAESISRTRQTRVVLSRAHRQNSRRSRRAVAAAMSGLPPNRNVNANDTEFVGVPGPPAGPIHNVDYYQR